MIRRYIVSSFHGVNLKFPSFTHRSDPAASDSASRTGRAFRGGITGRARDGAVAHFEPSRAAEARRSCGGSPRVEKRLLWSDERSEARPAAGQSQRVDARTR